MAENVSDIPAFYGSYPFPGVGVEKTAQYLDHLLEHVYDVTDGLDSGVWLDVGCGTGEVLSLAAQRHPEMQFVGLDLSQASLDRARMHCELLGVDNVRLHRVDVREADFAELCGGRASVVNAIGSLHMFPETAEVVARLAQNLNPDGVFVLGVYGLQGRWRQEQFRQAILSLIPEPDFARRQRLLLDELLHRYQDLPVYRFLMGEFGDAAGVPDQWWQDTFLAPFERQFRGEEVFDMLRDAGCAHVEWLNPPIADDELRGDEWRQAFAALDQREQYKVLDRLADPSFHYFAGSPRADVRARAAAARATRAGA